MDTKSTFLLQVLEKLAAPMVAAISEVSVRQALIPDPTQPGAMRPEAEQVAGLLTKSTQLSIGLSNLMDMRQAEAEADSIRLALTSLASPLMSNIYRLAGRSPTDAEIKRIADAMGAVVSYSDGVSRGCRRQCTHGADRCRFVDAYFRLRMAWERAVPDPSELLTDILALENWRTQVHKRSEETAKKRKAGPPIAVGPGMQGAPS